MGNGKATPSTTWPKSQPARCSTKSWASLKSWLVKRSAWPLQSCRCGTTFVSHVKLVCPKENNMTKLLNSAKDVAGLEAGVRVPCKKAHFGLRMQKATQQLG